MPAVFLNVFKALFLTLRLPVCPGALQNSRCRKLCGKERRIIRVFLMTGSRIVNEILPKVTCINSLFPPIS